MKLTAVGEADGFPPPLSLAAIESPLIARLHFEAGDRSPIGLRGSIAAAVGDAAFPAGVQQTAPLFHEQPAADRALRHRPECFAQHQDTRRQRMFAGGDGDGKLAVIPKSGRPPLRSVGDPFAVQKKHAAFIRAVAERQLRFPFDPEPVAVEENGGSGDRFGRFHPEFFLRYDHKSAFLLFACCYYSRNYTKNLDVCAFL